MTETLLTTAAMTGGTVPQNGDGGLAMAIAAILLILFIVGLIGLLIFLAYRTTRETAYRKYYSEAQQTCTDIENKIENLHREYELTKKNIDQCLNILSYVREGFSTNIGTEYDCPEKREIRRFVAKRIFDNSHSWSNSDIQIALGCLTDDRNIKDEDEEGYIANYRRMYLRGLLEGISDERLRSELVTYMMNLDWFECTVAKTDEDFNRMVKTVKPKEEHQEKKDEIEKIVQEAAGKNTEQENNIIKNPEKTAAPQQEVRHHRRGWKSVGPSNTPAK